MLLLIDSLLTEPPSSITLFRDITLYANVFKNHEILLECDNEMKDYYYKWLKQKGAFDFISVIVPYGSEKGVSIRSKYDHESGTIRVRSIGYHNFDRIISNI